MAEYVFLQAINGLVTGLIYAIAAAGLTIIFSVLKIVNFGHGVLYMLGGYVGYYAITLLGMPPVVAVLVAMVATFIVGAIFERLMLSPLYSGKVDRKDEYAIIVTFGLFMLMENAAIVVFGPFNKRPPSFVEGGVHIGILTITYDRLVAAASAAVLVLGLSLFMQRTSIGQALDAVSQSRTAAAIIGIDSRRMFTIAFGLGAALAGGAGALIAPIFSLTPTMGELPAVQAYIIVVLGGMGSVPGSIIGGILLGVVEALGVALYPDANRALAYSTAFGALLLILTLLVRPTGLFGRQHVRMD